MNQLVDVTALRVKASEKKMINSKADVNQLVPFKYPWAWSMYLKSCENHWMPQETRLENLKDKYSKATVAQIQAIDTLIACIGNRTMYGTDMDYVEGLNMLFMYRHNTAPECRQYYLRQGFEEVIKAHLYNYLCEALGNSPEPSSVVVTTNTLDLVYDNKQESFSTQISENAIKYIKFLIENILIQKGYLDSSVFEKMVCLRDDFPDLYKLFGFVFRDNINHVQFAIRVINTIFEENPQLDRYDPEITASFRFAYTHPTSAYTKACYDEYRMAIQTTYKPAGHTSSQSFNHVLDLPLFKQHLDEANHTTVLAPTSVSGLDWD